MTIEITSKNYSILMAGLRNRTERVTEMIRIFNLQENSEEMVERYQQELKDIELLEGDIRKAFFTL